jgi:endonuclease V-like protein UPF0215 family
MLKLILLFAFIGVVFPSQVSYRDLQAIGACALKVSSNGKCGPANLRTRCGKPGVFCSKFGWCGVSALHKSTHQPMFDGRLCKAAVKVAVKGIKGAAKKAIKTAKKPVAKKAKKAKKVKKGKKVLKAKKAKKGKKGKKVLKAKKAKKGKKGKKVLKAKKGVKAKKSKRAIRDSKHFKNLMKTSLTAIRQHSKLLKSKRGLV